MGRGLTTDEFFLQQVKAGVLKVSKSGIVTNMVTGNVIGTGKSSGYLRVGMVEYHAEGSRNRTISLHRLVWLAHKGPIPKGYTVNHRDGNTLHNHLLNFNLLTRGDNARDSKARDLSEWNKLQKRLKTGGHWTDDLD